jgi:superfamily I DNA/RNA helicase
MNIERFNSIMYDIVLEEGEKKLTALLQSFQAAFNQNINQPNPSTVDTFLKARQALWEALAACRCNQFPPSQKAFLDSIEATKFVGNGLREELESILEKNASLPGQAVAEVQKHVQQTLKFIALVTTANKALVELNIENDFTGPNEYEVGVLLPSKLFNNDLEGLQKELARLNLHLKIFGELAADDVSSPKIRCVTNGSVDVFLEAAAPVAVLLLSKGSLASIFIYSRSRSFGKRWRRQRFQASI